MPVTLQRNHSRIASSPANDRIFRIAIVGGGPKGLYCLDCLSSQLGDLDRHPEINITVFEPSLRPGAGVVYDPDQPRFLRMNFASRYIDAWQRQVGERDASSRPNLVQWLEQRYPSMASRDAFVPRALVGEYLHWCFGQVLDSMPPHVQVRQVRAAVIDVANDGMGWRVQTDESRCLFDEVLLTVGHEGWRPATRETVPPARADTTCWIDSVFPVTEQLSADRVAPARAVAVRGFGLTWIDACLALTEGRGGEFIKHNDTWSYRHGGREPRAIIPFSRTGRPLLAKPDLAKFSLPAQIDDVWRHGLDRLMQLRRKTSGLDFDQLIWPILLETAGEGLQQIEASQDRRGASDRIASWFRKWMTQLPDPTQILKTMQRSYDIAGGRRQPDEAWILGETWRQLYPALVEITSHGGLAAGSWPQFRRYATEMERIAFGPPAENLGRMIALIQAGIIDLRFIRSTLCQSNGLTEVQMDGARRVVDVIVGAVLPSSQALAPRSVLANLIDSGVLRPAEGAGGIAIDGDGRPLSNDGVAVQGLAVIGRPTEGCVLGNDTLSRRLHDHPNRWAKSVVRRIAHKGSES